MSWFPQKYWEAQLLSKLVIIWRIVIMFLEHQISILQLILMDHVTLKTEAEKLLKYVWKVFILHYCVAALVCIRDFFQKHKNHTLQTANFWIVLYIFQDLLSNFCPKMYLLMYYIWWNDSKGFLINNSGNRLTSWF